MTTGYFITGASGFIGKRLVKKILARGDTTVYYLSRATGAKGDKQRAGLLEYWGVDGEASHPRAIAVMGDLTQADLGVSAADKKKLAAKVAHFAHLAAVYDLKASAEEQQAGNIDGTRNAVQFANAIKAGDRKSVV